ncbi:MAG: hypothetical protein CBB97_16160 [Candidatus Endolissoclinum sp. TMED37]|nr:MAG: hypothetical protein CBB97_16160 [Candidatus Endolissoclinum sp. TMED37]
MSENIIKQFEKYRSKIDLEYLSTTHVHYCTPCYGGQITEGFFRSWSKTHMTYTKYGIPYSVTTSANESLITRARCHMVSYMMANPKATHLMFIDADINFNCIDILHMLQHDKDIIVGAYPKKDLDWREFERKVLQGKQRSIEELKSLGSNYALNFHWQDNEETKEKEIITSDGLIKLKDAATGFMLIKREVFMKMMDAYPDLYFHNDLQLPKEESKYTYLFFDAMHEKETKRYLSEDYAFCRRWQAIGGEVWLDPLINLDHIGHFTFPGEISKLFQMTNDPNSLDEL